MRQLRDDTHLILDGEVRVYRRARSKRWQAAFNIDGHTIRVSTGKRDLAEAKEYARDTYLEYKFRHKNDLPIVTKKFSDVARLAIELHSVSVLVAYGARVIAADGTNNAVFVKALKDVGAVLDAFAAAAAAGELDAAITKVAQRQPRLKPGAARATANA